MPKRKQWEDPEKLDEHHVEYIKSCTMGDDNEWLYEVKWFGWPDNRNTWEPRHYLKCDEALARFHEHVGIDEDVFYPIGTHMRAKSRWIEREEKRFRENYPDASEEPVWSPRKKPCISQSSKLGGVADDGFIPKLTIRIPPITFVCETPSPTRTRSTGSTTTGSVCSDYFPQPSSEYMLASSPTQPPLSVAAEPDDEQDEACMTSGAAEDESDNETIGLDDLRQSSSPSMLLGQDSLSTEFEASDDHLVSQNNDGDVGLDYDLFAPIDTGFASMSLANIPGSQLVQVSDSLMADLSTAIQTELAPKSQPQPPLATSSLDEIPWYSQQSVYFSAADGGSVYLFEAEFHCSNPPVNTAFIRDIFGETDVFKFGRLYGRADWDIIRRSLGTRWLLRLDVKPMPSNDQRRAWQLYLLKGQLAGTSQPKFTCTQLSQDTLLVMGTARIFENILSGSAALRNAGDDLIGLVYCVTPTLSSPIGRLAHNPPLDEEKYSFKHTSRNLRAAKLDFSTRFRPAFYHRLFQLPDILRRWLKCESRSFFVWEGRIDGSARIDRTVALEAEALRVLLTHEGAREVPANSTARLLFIPVGLMNMLRVFPGESFAKRLTQGHVCVYSYGTSPNVPPAAWGVREIFKHGGIMTFTSRAILEAPWKVRSLILKAREHPLWTSFTSSAIIGEVARIVCPLSMDPLKFYDSGQSPLSWMFHLVEHGSILLLESSNSGTTFKDEYTDLRSVLKPYLRPDTPTQGNAVKELQIMQGNVAANSFYRRFVVVDVIDSDRLKVPCSLEHVSVHDPFPWLDDLFGGERASRK